MVDWKNYRTTFPKRYIELSRIDDVVEEKVNDLKFGSKVLDIGGGDGTNALKKRALEKSISVLLLDPFVDPVYWMQGKVDWENDIRFDLIVARGSINYLLENEIRKIPKMGKFFIANSFKLPPSKKWTEREYENAKGETGIERFKYVSSKNIIIHELICQDGKTISHSFFYYTEDQYKEMIPNVKIFSYDKNSILLTLRK